jgi:hypothetical protein
VDGQDKVHSATGWDCALQFLNDLNNLYEMTQYDYDQGISPTIRLLAHNLSYDFAFLAKHLSDIQTLERGTDIIVAFADFRGQKSGAPSSKSSSWTH